MATTGWRMSLAVAGLAAQSPVEIQGAEIMDESFPGFAAVCMLGATGTAAVIEIFIG